MPESKKPVKRFQAGNISVSIWNNTGKTKEGKDFTFMTASLQRSYKDAKNEWKNESINLRANDIGRVHLVLQEAFKEMVQKEKTEAE
jgi:hypothetical protein